MPLLKPDERELKMTWVIEKKGAMSYLAVTTNLFPYSFRKSLTKHIDNAKDIILETPIDKDNMQKVIKSGLSGEGAPSLYDALDEQTILKINKELDFAFQRYTPFVSPTALLGPGIIDWLYYQIKGLKPWMAFFDIWAHYLRRRGWKYMMEIDAFRIAKKMNKSVYFLESAEEQIRALDGISIERLRDTLRKIDRIEGCVEKFVDCYTKGYFSELLDVIDNFPAYYPPIIEKRNHILYERMKAFLERGGSLIFMGVMHISGIQRMLLDDGYKVERTERIC